MPGLGPRLWSTCKSCSTHQWNDVLLKENGKCRRCSRPVALFKPKPSKDQSQSAKDDTLHMPGGKSGRSGGSGNKAAAGSEAAELLDKTIAATTDPSIKQALQAQRASLAAQPLGRLMGTWRDADAKHAQAVQHVIKCRENLVRAEAKERETAETLAQASIARQIAVKALAQASGLSVDGSQECKQDLFEIKWDTSFFEPLDSMEIEESERRELKELEEQLKQAKAKISERSEQMQAWLERMKAMQKEVVERTSKKRKTVEQAVEQTGAAATPSPTATAGAKGSGSGSASSAGPSINEAQEKAAALSKARFEAEEAKKAAEQVAKSATDVGGGSEARHSYDFMAFVETHIGESLKQKWSGKFKAQKLKAYLNLARDT
ncbi:unnamed protein product, partial [Prorocentrum cordatum]